MGLFSYKHSKKIKLHLLALPALLLVSALISVSTPIVANAVTKISAMTPDQSAQAFVFYKALRTCLTTGTLKNDGDFPRVNSNSMNAQDAVNYEWFHSGVTDVGVLGDTGDGDGAYACTDSEGRTFLRKITQLTGYASGPEILCAIGFTRAASGGACSTIVSGAVNDFIGPADKGGKLDTWWQNTIGASNLGPGGIGPGEYMLYYRSFIKGCGVAEDPNGNITIKAPSADGTSLVDKKFAYADQNKNGGTSIRLYSGSTRTCAQLASELSGSSSAVRAMTAWMATDGNVIENPEGDVAGEESAQTCVIEAIGWILCPVMNFTAGIVDAAYGFVASLLVIQPLLTTGSTEGVYNAWSVMRNIANIAFVIAFLIIIISQTTGVGISNYGVKKLLPRVVLVAILVNISYWVAAIAVDASNVLGASMNTLFESIGGAIPAAGAPNTGAFATGEGWTGVVGGVLAGTIAAGALYYVMLSALIPALIAALLAIVTVFLVLALRQALIILLVVISPLAFVAYLLPNTEDLFTKWRKLLTTLLLMYPIIAALFGASALASTIVMQSASGPYEIAIQVMGALIAILPLALTPIVMKTAGGVMNRFAGFVNNVEKGPADRLRKAGEAFHQDRRNLRNKRALDGANQLGRGAFVRFGARRKGIMANREAGLKRTETEYLADQAKTNEDYKKAAAGGTLTNKADAGETQRVLASAIATQDKLEAEEVSAAGIILRDAKLSQDEMRTLALGNKVTSETVGELDSKGSVAMRSAAMKQVIDSVDMDGINQVWDQVSTIQGEEGDKLRTSMANHLQSAGYRPAYIGQGAIASMRQAKVEMDPNTGEMKSSVASSHQLIKTAIDQNAYSPERLAKTDKDEIRTVIETVNRAERGEIELDLDATKVTQMRENAVTALTDPELGTSVNKNMDRLIELSSVDPVTMKQMIKESRGGPAAAPNVNVNVETEGQPTAGPQAGPTTAGPAPTQPQPSPGFQAQAAQPQASQPFQAPQQTTPPQGGPTTIEIKQQQASGRQVGEVQPIIVQGSGPSGVYVPGDRGFNTRAQAPTVPEKGPGSGPGGFILPEDKLDKPDDDGNLPIPH